MIKFIFYRTLNSQSATSITVANLCGLLRNKGYDVEMTLLEKNEPNIISNISKNAKKHPILIYKLNAMDYEKTFAIISNLVKKKVFKKIYLLGPFASLNGEIIMAKYHWIDGVVLGTGEYAVLELAKTWEGAICFKKEVIIEGGIWRLSSGSFIRKDIEHKILLNELPCPARDVDMIQKERIANLEFSRGCENLCRYCHLRAYYEQFDLRRECKTVDQVMEDLRNLYTLGKRYFVFNDSVFWNDESDSPRLLEWCRQVKKSGLKIFFMVYLSLYHFPPISLIERLKDVGLIRVFIGVESLDTNILHIIKPLSYPSFKIEDIREKLEKMYISCHIGYIVFFPFSSLNQVEESIEFLNSLGMMFRVGIMLERLRLIPYTPMEQYMEKTENLLDRAYAYKITDERAELLQTQWMDIFETQLHDTYIKIELLCTAGDLAISILMQGRNTIPDEVQNHIEQHRNNIKSYNQCIYRFVKESITYVRCKQYVLFTKQFENEYYASMDKLQNSWLNLYQSINKYINLDLEKMIPTGEKL